MNANDTTQGLICSPIIISFLFPLQTEVLCTIHVNRITWLNLPGTDHILPCTFSEVHPNALRVGNLLQAPPSQTLSEEIAFIKLE
jgi:hypothetical protein